MFALTFVSYSSYCMLLHTTLFGKLCEQHKLVCNYIKCTHRPICCHNIVTSEAVMVTGRNETFLPVREINIKVCTVAQ